MKLPKLTKTHKLILKIVVSSVLIFVIFTKVDKTQLIENIKLLNWLYVPFILLFIILNYVIGAFRWKKMLIFKNTEHVKVNYLVNLYFIGSFFNNFMPTSIGGDVYKVFKLGKKIHNTTDAFTSTFMERFSGVFVLMLVSIFGLVNNYGAWVILIFIFFIACFFIGIKFLDLVSRKIIGLRKMYDSLMTYKGQNRVISYALFTSIFVQILAIATHYLMFLAIGVKLPVFYSLFIFPIITLAGFFIPSLNGLGVQDALYMQMFAVVGVPTEISLSASILYHLSRLTVSLIGGILYALGKDE